MKKLTKQDVIILALMLLIGFGIGFGVSFIKEREKTPPVQPKVIIQQKFVDTDTLSLDLLHKLETTLKKREGLSLTSYQDKKGYWYIGYGSMLNYKYANRITEKEADSILTADILASFKEVRRIQKARLEKDIFKMFCTEKLK